MSNHKLDICGCCKGEKRVTPGDTYNRPGLDALAYRVGTHAAFFETMIAALARQKIALETADERGQEVTRQERPLEQLKTLRRDDFSIALLDAWATIADVLAFYQERIANEGYLRTATERRSILELARLVGYELRPGVSASTFLSFIVEQAQKAALIPKGTRAQSVPQPGETMESFETMRDLEARYEYNELKLRTAQVQFLAKPDATQETSLPTTLYLPGQRNDLRPSDRFLLAFGNRILTETSQFTKDESYYLARVARASLLDEPACTAVSIEPDPSPLADIASETTPTDVETDIASTSSGRDLAGRSVMRRRMVSMYGGAAAGAWTETYYLEESLSSIMSASYGAGQVPTSSPESVAACADNQDVALQGLGSFSLQFPQALYASIGQQVASPLVNISALVALVLLRLRARLHGHSALRRGVTMEGTGTNEKEEQVKQYETKLYEWTRDDAPEEWDTLFTSAAVTLDGLYDQVAVGNLVVLEWLQDGTKQQALFRVSQIDSVSTSLFNVQSTATQLRLEQIAGDAWSPATMAIIRSTMVYVGGELVTNPVPYRVLAEEPVTDDLLGGENVLLELDGIYGGFKPGRWIALTGLRTDIPVIGREVALIGVVEHRFAKRADGTDLPGDLRHTFLTLATPLSLSYQRATVIINANVVPATHGETARGVPPREQDVILGSGDAAQAHQRLALKLPPEKRLTYLSAPTRDGVESTLKVYVNDVLWDWRSTLLGSGPRDHVYTVQTGDEGETDVIFGDGQEGARPPTGRENVFARYRIGIGKAGNVKAEQISLLATRPAGVKEVINPVPASGGTDPEGRDQARRNVPFAARTLDRLVGLPDYEDFAHTFAGIGKARAQPSGSPATGITVWVAGEDSTSLQADSEAVANLQKALDRHDGSNVAIDVKLYTPLLITLEATVWIAPDRLWERVQPAILTELAKAFGFDQRNLGQPVALSEIVDTIQRVPGVVHLQVTRFATLTREQLEDQASQPQADNQQTPQVVDLIEMDDDELAFIDPAATSLIVLKEPEAIDKEQEDETA